MPSQPSLFGDDEPKAKDSSCLNKKSLDPTLRPVIDLFERAALHLKWPKIRFGRMTLCWTRYRSVMVKLSGDHRRYVAFINNDGSLAAHGISDNLIRFLHTFAKDPVHFAALEGIRTGNCCFCGRELTDPASVTVGYGPICADHYGLPWGERSFENKPQTIEEIEGEGR